MSTLTPKQVGDEMSIYTFRPGEPRLKKELMPSINKFYCFDKGHLRIAGSVPSQFVPVPERIILEFFGTKYALNIRKMERAIEEYASVYDVFVKNGKIKGSKPMRPTIRSLYLEKPSEFETFIEPLSSFYCNYLRQSFAGVLNIVEKGGRWKRNVNSLKNATDGKRRNRWAQATRDIYVRLHDFGKLKRSTPRVTPPPYLFPYPANGPALAQPAAPTVPVYTPEELKEKKDLDMLERTNMGRSRKYRKVLLYMSPWKNCIRTANPFVSQAYRAAYTSAQHAFELKYVDFKQRIQQRRIVFRKEWAAFKAFKDDQRSVKPSLSFVEAPSPENFDKEWREFIFGMKQEMKNIVFEPIRGAQAVAAAQTIQRKRTTDPNISTVPNKPIIKPTLKPTVIKQLEPVIATPPMVLPALTVGKPKAAEVNVQHHTKDPDLLLIENDLKYAKRVMVN